MEEFQEVLGPVSLLSAEDINAAIFYGCAGVYIQPANHIQGRIFSSQ